MGIVGASHKPHYSRYFSQNNGTADFPYFQILYGASPASNLEFLLFHFLFSGLENERMYGVASAAGAFTTRTTYAFLVKVCQFAQTSCSCFHHGFWNREIIRTCPSAIIAVSNGCALLCALNYFGDFGDDFGLFSFRGNLHSSSHCNLSSLGWVQDEHAGNSCLCQVCDNLVNRIACSVLKAQTDLVACHNDWCFDLLGLS